MAQEPLLECSFLVPLRRDADLSDGELHSAEAWEWLDDELFARFGGRTIAPGWHEGLYRDPETKRRVDDLSRKYIVAISAHVAEQLRAMLRHACQVFQQKCIYLSIAGQVEFIEAET